MIEEVSVAEKRIIKRWQGARLAQVAPPTLVDRFKAEPSTLKESKLPWEITGLRRYLRRLIPIPYLRSISNHRQGQKMLCGDLNGK